MEIKYLALVILALVPSLHAYGPPPKQKKPHSPTTPGAPLIDVQQSFATGSFASASTPAPAIQAGNSVVDLPKGPFWWQGPDSPFGKEHSNKVVVTSQTGSSGGCGGPGGACGLSHGNAPSPSSNVPSGGYVGCGGPGGSCGGVVPAPSGVSPGCGGPGGSCGSASQGTTFQNNPFLSNLGGSSSGGSSSNSYNYESSSTTFQSGSSGHVPSGSSSTFQSGSSSGHVPSGSSSTFQSGSSGHIPLGSSSTTFQSGSSSGHIPSGSSSTFQSGSSSGHVPSGSSSTFQSGYNTGHTPSSVAGSQTVTTVQGSSSSSDVYCGRGNVCVPRHLCQNGYVVESGERIIQVRGNQRCNSNTEACCRVPPSSTTTNYVGSASYAGTPISHTPSVPTATNSLIHITPKPGSSGFATGAGSTSGFVHLTPGASGVVPGQGGRFPGAGGSLVGSSQTLRPNSLPPSPIPPQLTTPYPGCAAALKCVKEIYCNAEGVMVNEPVYLTRDQQENRVPITDCSNPETGEYGKCCRDPNYKDPWPDMLGGAGQHSHVEHTHSHAEVQNCGPFATCVHTYNCNPSNKVQPITSCRVPTDKASGVCCAAPNNGQSIASSQVRPIVPGPQPVRPGSSSYQESSYNFQQQQQQSFTQQAPRPSYSTPRPSYVSSQQTVQTISQTKPATIFQQRPSTSHTTFPLNPSPSSPRPSYGSSSTHSQSSFVQSTRPQPAASIHSQSTYTQTSATRPQTTFSAVTQGLSQHRPAPSHPQPAVTLVTQSIPQTSSTKTQSSHFSTQSFQRPVTQTVQQSSYGGVTQGLPQPQPSPSQPHPSFPRPSPGFVQQPQPQPTVIRPVPTSQTSSFASQSTLSSFNQHDHGSSLTILTPSVQQIPVNPGTSCGVRRVESQGSAPDGPTSFGEFPWHALITSRNKSGLCSGVLVSNKAVLTSAHCVNELRPSDIFVKLGKWKLGSDDEPISFQEVGVVAIAKHPDFQPGSLFSDLSLLLLREPAIPNRHVDVVCLPENNEQFDEKICVSSGWGRDAVQGRRLGTLHRLNLKVQDNPWCEHKLRQTYLGKYFILNKSFTCASGDGTTDMCKIDVGGPLVCDRGDSHYVLAGVSSWDVGCNDKSSPAVFAHTDVQWINSVLSRPAEEFVNRQDEQNAVEAQENLQIDTALKPGFSQGYGRK